MSIFYRSTVIIPAVGAPPSDETICDILRFTKADWAAMAPATVQSIGETPSSLREISEQLRDLVVMGGTPSAEMGNLVSKHINIHNLLGSSECGGLPQFLSRNKSTAHLGWEYMKFHPCAKPDLRSHDSGSYELFITRDAACTPHQPVFIQFPDLEEHSTQDLFEPHPSLPDYWRHVGRVDDVIVFSSGEKTNPISFESHVLDHEDVDGAIVFGSGRMEAGLLLELKKEVLDADQFSPQGTIDKIWPKVEEANSSAPEHARVGKHLVHVASSGKRFPRTAKGTVKRQEALDMFHEEIQSVYDSLDPAYDSGHTERQGNMDLEEVRHQLKQAYEESMDGELSDESGNFFDMGMDSLRAIRFVREANRRGLGTINTKAVYAHPSIHELAQAFHQPQSSQKARDVSDGSDHKAKPMEEIIDDYKERIEKLRSSNTKIGDHKRVEEDMDVGQGCKDPTVLVTGTTGFIGSTEDGESSQSRGNARRDENLATSFPQGRVTFLSADLTASEYFGLEPEKWTHLVENVSLVIHLAWPVDFNLPLSTFLPSLDGLVNLIHFCHIGRRSPALLFVSSISAALQFHEPTVPEEVVHDASAPVYGYGESKYVGEHLVQYASENLQVKSGIIRLGQVAGATNSGNGWNTRDWIPRLVKSSHFLNAVPEDLGANDTVNWLPIDIVAKCIYDIGVSISTCLGCRVFNLINPHTLSWGELVPVVVDALEDNSSAPGTKGVRRVSGTDWVKLLSSSVQEISAESNDDENPAASLLEFFQETFGQASHKGRDWATQNAAETSCALRELGIIRQEWLRRWVDNWLVEKKY
ncbi:unnamed protein product [Clonostachys rosea]|uniref:Carrier domain-containing protein n=1 Tax=Bionectria ochroleuca TaxID=29856 RepID=A0ABY6V4H4_BIOOC|nr:unnamed protein product [Clonostachys rosea]